MRALVRGFAARVEQAARRARDVSKVFLPEVEEELFHDAGGRRAGTGDVTRALRRGRLGVVAVGLFREGVRGAIDVLLLDLDLDLDVVLVLRLRLASSAFVRHHLGAASALPDGGIGRGSARDGSGLGLEMVVRGGHVAAVRAVDGREVAVARRRLAREGGIGTLDDVRSAGWDCGRRGGIARASRRRRRRRRTRAEEAGDVAVARGRRHRARASRCQGEMHGKGRRRDSREFEIFGTTPIFSSR